MGIGGGEERSREVKGDRGDNGRREGTTHSSRDATSCPL